MQTHRGRGSGRGRNIACPFTALSGLGTGSLLSYYYKNILVKYFQNILKIKFSFAGTITHYTI